MELNQIKSYVLKNLYTGLTKTIVTLGLSLIAIPLIIKNIGLERYGWISIVLVFSSFTGVLDLGLSKALIAFQNEKSENEKEVTGIYVINLLLFVVLLVIASLVYYLDLNLLGGSLEVDHSILRLINSIAVLLLAFSLLNNLLRASLEANFKLQLINWGFLIQSVIINLGWLILSLINADIKSFLFVPVLSSIITIIFHLISLPAASFISLKRPDKKSLRNVFILTSQFFKVGTLNSIHLPIIKYIIILFLGDGRAIGIFELSTKLSVIANNLLAYISNPFFSITSKHHSSNKEYLWGLIRKTTGVLISITMIGYITFFFLEEFIIHYFFDTYNNQIFRVLNFVLIGYLSIAATESVQKFFLGTGDAAFVAKVKFTGILFNGFLLLFFYLMGSFSFLNISFSYALSLMFIGAFWLLQLVRNLTAFSKISFK